MAIAGAGIYEGTVEHVEAMWSLKNHVVAQAWGDGRYSSEELDAWRQRFVTQQYFLDCFANADTWGVARFFLVGEPHAPDAMIAVKDRDGHASIGDLYVRDRGKGVGRDLLRFALAEAAAAGFSSAIADIHANNHPSLNLFYSHGFTVEYTWEDEFLREPVKRLTRLITTSDESKVI